MADLQTNGAAAANMDTTDVEMKEELPATTNMNSIAAASPAPQPPPQTEHLSTMQSLQPATAQTPPTTSGASARPTSMPPQPVARPDKAVAHGGPTRQYLNAHITPHLLEGMKYLAAYEPEKPLQWLADFLKERSKEIEG
ncbi:hypothetical protein B0A50_04145 [Salinomyces thailandicus]|uniref:Dpy-30 domain-containing protein n=1 Tax=Salinomyces thailandicus TaxID=706561 RepID=A0A4U0U0G9_9PEZI|nr:hypothetical protein B0A50_04145 [Salinomyces thailandica]